MFDVAALLATQPPPAGRRVAIITNAGGPGILCADACEAEGLVVPVLDERTQARLREVLPAEASTANLMDMIASVTPEQYRRVLRIVADDPGADAVIVILIPPLVTRAEDVSEAVVAAAREIDRRTTVLTVFMSSREVPEVLRRPDVGLRICPVCGGTRRRRWWRRRWGARTAGRRPGRSGGGAGGLQTAHARQRIVSTPPGSGCSCGRPGAAGGPEGGGPRGGAQD